MESLRRSSCREISSSFFSLYSDSAFDTARGMSVENRSWKLAAGEGNWIGLASAALPGGSKAPNSGTRSL